MGKSKKNIYKISTLYFYNKFFNNLYVKIYFVDIMKCKIKEFLT